MLPTHHHPFHLKYTKIQSPKTVPHLKTRRTFKIGPLSSVVGP